jgi:hypothetical protein
MLRKAHGWGFQGYWRNERDCAAPVAEDVAERITFLTQELALSDEALRKVLLLFPEALGLDLKQRMRPNVVRGKNRCCARAAGNRCKRIARHFRAQMCPHDALILPALFPTGVSGAHVQAGGSDAGGGA